jgi:flagellar biosynthesis/type III secretory pathway protein FliH
MAAIPSFPQPQVELTLKPVPSSPQNDVISVENQILALAAQLSKEQRKRVLAQAFADDLKLLVTQETEAARQLGLVKGTEQASVQQEQATANLKGELELQKAALAELIANFKPAELQLPANVLPTLMNWQVEAVFRVLGHETRDKQFLLENLQQVVAETVLLKGVDVHCHPSDINYLAELIKAHPHINNVVANTSLTPGDIRVVCGDTQITSSLAQRLQQLSAHILTFAETCND